MAQMSVEELYRGDGAGAKYGSGGIMGAVTREMMTRGVPEGYDEQTWLRKNENRGRLCIGNDRCGVALFLCGED